MTQKELQALVDKLEEYQRMKEEPNILKKVHLQKSLELHKESYLRKKSWLMSLRKSAQPNYTPPTPTIRLWFDFMTQKDYVLATATSRTTIGKFLTREPKANRAASQEEKGDREKAKYKYETSLMVLIWWLCVRTKDKAKRRSWGLLG